MQGGVAEDGVELLAERQPSGVDNPRVEMAIARRRDLSGARIDRNQTTTRALDELRQPAVAAAEIEDALARLGIENPDDLAAVVRDEAAVPFILLRIPLLGHGRRCGRGLAGEDRREMTGFG